MKRIIILLLIVLPQITNAQQSENVSIFNRLLILNAENELLVVKISNTDFWVTPGLYQNSHQSINVGLDSIAATYGVTLSNTELRGIFTLKRELNGKKSTSLRNVFVAQGIKTNENLLIPKGIEKVKWLSIEEALAQMTFPHTNFMIEKIVQNPEVVWGGTLLQFKEGNEFKSKVLEEFHPMFGSKKCDQKCKKVCKKE
jgi:hypothetical protein